MSAPDALKSDPKKPRICPIWSPIWPTLEPNLPSLAQSLCNFFPQASPTVAAFRDRRFAPNVNQIFYQKWQIRNLFRQNVLKTLLILIRSRVEPNFPPKVTNKELISSKYTENWYQQVPELSLFVPIWPHLGATLPPLAASNKVRSPPGGQDIVDLLVWMKLRTPAALIAVYLNQIYEWY